MNGDRIIGFVVHNDWFGNLINNLSKRLLDKLRIIEGVLFDVNLGGVSKIIRFCRAYGEVPDNYPIVIIGSSGFLEVSINPGRTLALFKAVIESKVDFILCTV